MTWTVKWDVVIYSVVMMTIPIPQIEMENFKILSLIYNIYL